VSIQVSYKKQVGLGFILFLVIIGVVEGLSRLYEFLDPNCDFIRSDAFKKLDYFLQIQICLDNNYLRYIEHEWYITYEPNQHHRTININSDGFRGPEIIKEKGDTYRIFFLGGSTAFGSGATADDNTIPGYLQKKILDYGFSKKVEVINAGISGYNSIEEKYLIENYLLNFEPDLLIIYDGWNDVTQTKGLIEIFDDKGNTLGIKKIQEKDTKPFKFKNFPQYRTPFVINQIFFNPELYLMPTSFDELNVSSWKDRWIHICKLGKNEGFSTIVSVQPILGSSERTFHYKGVASLSVLSAHISGHLETLEGLANSLPELDEYCARTVDLRNVFDNVEEPIYLDTGHTTDFGNEIIAQKLFEEIIPTIEIIE